MGMPPGSIAPFPERTDILAQDFSDGAQNLGLSERDLDKVKDLMGEVSVIPEA